MEEIPKMVREVAQFGLGERIVLLGQFLRKGDQVKLAQSLNVTATFVSQVLRRQEERYKSRKVELALFKKARENAGADSVLRKAWEQLFGEALEG